MPPGEIATSRLEAFSDGVIAIIVHDHGAGVAIAVAADLASAVESSADFSELWTEFSGGRRHMREPSSPDSCGAGGYGRPVVVESKLAFLDVTSSICGRISGKNYHLPMAVALYGLDLSLCGVAFFVLRSELVRQSRHDTSLAEYHARAQRKNLLSAGLYFSAAPLA